jgi:hypothetical protein
MLDTFIARIRSSHMVIQRQQPYPFIDNSLQCLHGGRIRTVNHDNYFKTWIGLTQRASDRAQDKLRPVSGRYNGGD